MKESYEIQLKSKTDEIAFYKDYKAKLSTKMVDETLEQHCEIEFNRLRATDFRMLNLRKTILKSMKVQKV
ncbi:MAG: DUF2130 domain-containing protein [Acidimicrobiia bacterium]